MITFKQRIPAESEGWSPSGKIFGDPEQLALIKATLAKDGPVLVEHKYYKGARGPSTTVFEDFEEFVAYLESKVRAGDMISVWSLWPFMRDSRPLADGKCPNVDGAIPSKGGY